MGTGKSARGASDSDQPAAQAKPVAKTLISRRAGHPVPANLPASPWPTSSFPFQDPPRAPNTEGPPVDPVAREKSGVVEGVPVAREYLIENLQPHPGSLWPPAAAHLNALAEAMRLAMAEVYEVATFYPTST